MFSPKNNPKYPLNRNKFISNTKKKLTITLKKPKTKNQKPIKLKIILQVLIYFYNTFKENTISIEFLSSR
jgi:hypothetical protein